jgi:hypothetical protein
MILKYSNAWLWTASLLNSAFTTDQDLLDARRELEQITAAAIGKPVEELEAHDFVHDPLGIRKVKKIEKKKV